MKKSSLVGCSHFGPKRLISRHPALFFGLKTANPAVTKKKLPIANKRQTLPHQHIPQKEQHQINPEAVEEVPVDG
jgi:hypothetical protein